jgi:hypothetical protein
LSPHFIAMSHGPLGFTVNWNGSGAQRLIVDLCDDG